MIPNPILKVLSTLSSHEVRHLLMGGQACVFYGAAEFSRDCDIVVLADTANFARLQNALDELRATCIAIPPFEKQYLDRGHAVHFRCHHPEASGMRLDVMTKMRGCDDFASLWERRMSLVDSDGIIFEVIGIEDLVRAKKTQRSKDWPMIRRLVDAHYERNQDEPTDDRVRFWLRDSRTPDILISVAAAHPQLLKEMIPQRPLLVETLSASRTALREELEKEQAAEKEADEQYWRPLLQELGRLRRDRRR